MQGICRTPEGTLVAKFDRNVYGSSAVKKAAYKFGGLFDVLIEGAGEFTVVLLRPTAANSKPDEFVGDFCNEVLDQELREEIAAETRGVRDLLLAQAFSKTSLMDLEMEAANYETAPGPPKTDSCPEQ